MAKDARKRKARDGTLEVREGKGASSGHRTNQVGRRPNTTIWFADFSMSKDSFMSLNKGKGQTITNRLTNKRVKTALLRSLEVKEGRETEQQLKRKKKPWELLRTR